MKSIQMPNATAKFGHGFSALVANSSAPVTMTMVIRNNSNAFITPFIFFKFTKKIRKLSDCCYFCQMNVIEEFYYRQTGAVRETLLVMRDLILSRDPAITEQWKYNMPFFYFHGKMFCYLRINRQSGQPYLSMFDGKFIEHPLLQQESRKRMKILPLDPESDLPVEAITWILDRGLEIQRSRGNRGVPTR